MNNLSFFCFIVMAAVHLNMNAQSKCGTPDIDSTVFMNKPWIGNNQFLLDILDSIGQNFSRRPSLPCQSMVLSYYPNGINGIDSGYFVLSGTDCQLFKSVGIRIFNFSPTTDTINFLQSSFASSVSPYFSFEDQSIGEIQVVDSLISGFLKFDSFSDKQGDQNGIVSGNFEFIVTNAYLDTTIVVTEGSFQYIIDYEWY